MASFKELYAQRMNLAEKEVEPVVEPTPIQEPTIQPKVEEEALDLDDKEETKEEKDEGDLVEEVQPIEKEDVAEESEEEEPDIVTEIVPLNIEDEDEENEESEQLQEEDTAVRNTPSRQLRDNKFRITENGLLYPKNMVEKAKYFVKAYRYLANIHNTMDQDFENFDKVRLFIIELESLYGEILYLIEKYDNARNLSKASIINKITHLLTVNMGAVIELEDFVNPLGKTVKLYDPDENIGYY